MKCGHNGINKRESTIHLNAKERKMELRGRIIEHRLRKIVTMTKMEAWDAIKAISGYRFLASNNDYCVNNISSMFLSLLL